MASLSQIATPEQNSNALTGGQIATLVAIGIVFWLLAALLLRAIEPLGAFDGVNVAILYALVIPGTIPAVLLARRLARLRTDQTALGVTIVTGIATLLDGCALATIPALYGANPAGAGATILWGAGVALILGVLMNRSQ